MGFPAGVGRDFEALERRRMRAGSLLAKGLSQSEVARRVGAHRQSVSKWAAELQAKGRAGLKKAGRAGRKPRLSAEQINQIEGGLKRGPQALGYGTDLWTSERVAGRLSSGALCVRHVRLSSARFVRPRQVAAPSGPPTADALRPVVRLRPEERPAAAAWRQGIGGVATVRSFSVLLWGFPCSEPSTRSLECHYIIQY